MSTRKVLIAGVGMGLHHVTAEVAEALAGASYVIAATKGPHDNLLAARQAIAAHFDLDVVAVADPERDRADPSDYPAAVRSWHTARVAAYAEVLREREGTAAFLVWGDPSLYDSTIRIVEQLAELLPLEYDVLPGISAPQVLAARHRIVLHPVGAPVHVTTARRLREAVEAGQTNIAVMLSAGLELDGLDDWHIWWGANLGTGSEELVSGRVADVLATVETARSRAKQTAGWVMDVYLLKAPSSLLKAP